MLFSVFFYTAMFLDTFWYGICSLKQIHVFSCMSHSIYHSESSCFPSEAQLLPYRTSVFSEGAFNFYYTESWCFHGRDFYGTTQHPCVSPRELWFYHSGSMCFPEWAVAFTTQNLEGSVAVTTTNSYVFSRQQNPCVFLGDVWLLPYIIFAISSRRCSCYQTESLCFLQGSAASTKQNPRVFLKKT